MRCFKFLVTLFLFTGCTSLNGVYEDRYNHIHRFCKNVESTLETKSNVAKSHCIVEATKTERLIDRENKMNIFLLLYVVSLIVSGAILL